MGALKDLLEGKVVEGIGDKIPGFQYIQAKKQNNGKFKLFYRGTRNHPDPIGKDVFDGDYKSAKEAKDHWLAAWHKENGNTVKEDGDADNDGKPDVGDKAAYQKFFQKMLKKYGVESPEDLSDEDRKKFYAEIEAGWKADDETDESCGKPHDKKKKVTEGKTNNPDWGFFGTTMRNYGLSKSDVSKIFDKTSKMIAKRFKISEDDAVRFLDDTHGRHISDSLSFELPKLNDPQRDSHKMADVMKAVEDALKMRHVYTRIDEFKKWLKNNKVMKESLTEAANDGDADDDGKPEKGDKAEYQAFFKKMLKKYGVNSPEELSDEDRKKFYDEVDSKWKADHEGEVEEGKNPSFADFRSKALQGLTMMKKKDKKFAKMNKDEIEAWVKSEYERHYGKVKEVKESAYSILYQSVILREAEKKKEDEKKAKDAKAKAKDDKDENPAHLKLDDRPDEDEVPDELTIEFPEGVFLKLMTGSDEQFEQIKVKAQKLYADGEDTAVIAKALADEFGIEDWEIKDVNKMGEEEDDDEEGGDEPKMESVKPSLADILTEAVK